MKNFSYILKQTTSSLFSLKDLYKITHDSKGRLYPLRNLKPSMQKKLTYNNKHLSLGMSYTEENGIPLLQPYNGNIDFSLYPFYEHKKHNGNGAALHFFTDDYKFYNAITNKLEQTTYKIIDYDYIFAPDCSLYVDGIKQDNLRAIYYSRFAAAYWQNCGLNVIPVASWGNANSLSYCFEGLPKNSVIAVCGIGHSFCHEACTLWKYAIQELVKQISPTTLIVYGGKEKDTYDLPVKTKFISDYINKKFNHNACNKI